MKKDTDEKKYSRRLQSIVGGKLLKEFDRDCSNRGMNESEALREALREKYFPKNDRGTK